MRRGSSRTTTATVVISVHIHPFTTVLAIGLVCIDLRRRLELLADPTDGLANRSRRRSVDRHLRRGLRLLLLWWKVGCHLGGTSWCGRSRRHRAGRPNTG